MKFTLSATLCLFLFLFLFLTSIPVVQAEGEDAKSLFGRAEVHFKAGEFKEALVLYQRAYQLRPLPGFHFNMGQCHRGLGQFEKAIEQFQHYLKNSDPPKHRKEAEELILACQKELPQTKNMEPPKDLDSSRPGVEYAKDDSSTSGSRTRGADIPADGRRKLRSVYFWAGVGLTGALALTGTITGALALGKSSSYNDAATPRDELQGLKDAGESLRTASTVTFILALAAATGTAVTYFYTDFGSREKLVGATPLPGGGAVFLRGQF